MKKIAILTLALVFVLALVACGNTKPTQLGTSDFSIVLPNGYASTEDDFDEDQVAYFYKDDNSIDFDVYQWERVTSTPWSPRRNILPLNMALPQRQLPSME